MPAWLKVCAHGARLCGDAFLWVVCWVLWAALAGLLVVQIGISLTHELAVPGFVLRGFEDRFAAAHVHVRFGHATFDPAGGILVENLELSLPDFNEPVATVHAVFVQLDPWLLLAGRFEPRRVQATGVKLFTPAMLSPTGRSEEVLRDLEFDVTPSDHHLEIAQLTARLAGVAVDAHGGIELRRPPSAAGGTPLPLLASLASNYGAVSRQLIRASEQLAALDAPRLHAELVPSAARGAIASLTLHARALDLPALHGLHASDLAATVRLPLLGDARSIAATSLTVGELRLADGAVARDVQARIRSTFRLAPFSYAPRIVELSAREVAARGFTLHAATALAEPNLPSHVDAQLLAACAGQPLAVAGRIDLAQRAAGLQVDAALDPSLLPLISAAVHRDLSAYIGFGAPVAFAGQVDLGPDWKFERLAGHVAARQIDAYHVPMDSARGTIEFDGRRFIARDAVATLGENFARGTFEQDLASHDYRFLLEGRLRPLAIGGWFHEWWPNFFEHFEFPDAPPEASVDVAGRWRAAHESRVFVYAASRNARLRGAPFDYARTLIFVRPNFLDGLEFVGRRGAGELRGTFARTVEPVHYVWRELSFSLHSTLDLPTGAQLLGPGLADRLAPFAFEQAPDLRITGRFDGPAAPGGEHHEMSIEARSTGGFSLYRFPVRNLSFDARLRDTELDLPRVEAEVAGGVLSGHARAWGIGADRRLSFDATVRGANLGDAVSAVSAYTALRRGAAQASSEKFLLGKSDVKLDAALVAEGRFNDPFSYHGTGHAQLAGAQLGQIRLLGLLSELLNFTALRFTAARADFKLEGPKLIFPNVSVTGANSAIEAHGDYALDRRRLDFNARVYPFQQSRSLLSVVGVVLAPLSTALEVKLTGPLDQPNWAFVIGPTNLFRSLSESDAPTPAPLAPEKTR